MVLSLLLMISCTPVQDTIKPPKTEIVRIQPKYGPDGVIVEVTGKDERTPVDKLFYAYWVGDTIQATTTSNKILIDSMLLGEGTHTIKVAAVNHFNLADPEPPQREFVVDLTPPPTPQATAYLRSGKIHFDFSLAQKPDDFKGYLVISRFFTQEKDFVTYSDTYSISAEPAEYEFQVMAIDDVGNRSTPFTFTLDTNNDKAPTIINTLPARIGANHTEFELDVFDDWDRIDTITAHATLSHMPLEVELPFVTLTKPHTREGTSTLTISLVDSKGNQRTIDHELFIDLTPPETPYQPVLENTFGGYLLRWHAQNGVHAYRIYGLNDRDRGWELIDEINQNQFFLTERYLQYSITALDDVENESFHSYPARTYDEKYAPVVSAEQLTEFSDNTLLTTLFSPYIILNPIQVPKDVTVALERGVEVVFEEGGSFEVLGQLITLPSQTERRSRFVFHGANETAGILINGGSVWIENMDCIGSGGLFAHVINHGSFMGKDLNITQFTDIFAAQAVEQLLISNSQLEADTLLTGSNVKKMRLMDSVANTRIAIDVSGAMELCISGSILEASEIGILLRDLSNLRLTHTSIYAPKAVEASKFTTVDASDVYIESSEVGFKLTGASTLNLRKGEISGAVNGIHMKSSGYLLLLDSVIQSCTTGIRAENSDLNIIETIIRDNRIGIVAEGRHTLVQESLQLLDNEHDIIQR